MCRRCYATHGLPDEAVGERELEPILPPCACACPRDRLRSSGDNIWYHCLDCAPHAVRVEPRTSDGAEFPGQ